MTTKLTTSNLSAETLTAISGPRISNVKITDSSYNLIDDTAANISGGFIIINGQNFISNCQVLIDNLINYLPQPHLAYVLLLLYLYRSKWSLTQSLYMGKNMRYYIYRPTITQHFIS